MTLPYSQKPKELAFKASKNEKKTKNFENANRDDFFIYLNMLMRP